MTGGDLKKKCGQYDNDKEVSQTAFQVVYALKYLHELNICHGDIKADNCLLGECLENKKKRRSRKDRKSDVAESISEADCKLADFGLVQMIDPTGSNALTGFAGSLDHMAPEII